MDLNNTKTPPDPNQQKLEIDPIPLFSSKMKTCERIAEYEQDPKENKLPCTVKSRVLSSVYRTTVLPCWYREYRSAEHVGLDNLFQVRVMFTPIIAMAITQHCCSIIKMHVF